jgi:hypothetical protein
MDEMSAKEAADQCGVTDIKWWCGAKWKLVSPSLPRPFCRVFKLRGISKIFARERKDNEYAD